MGRRVFGSILACVVALAMVPEVCLACSCRMLPPDEAIARADIIFRGRVVRVSSQAFKGYSADGSFKEMGQRKAVFQVDSVWKGPALPLLSITHGIIADLNAAPGAVSISSCDISFYPGVEYLVFATWQTGWRDTPLALASYYCGATRETKYAADYLQALGSGTLIDVRAASSAALAAGMVIGAFEAMSPAITRGSAAASPHSRSRAPAIFTEFGFTLGPITVDRDGYVYVLDYLGNRNRILKFSPDGELVAVWSGRSEVVTSDEFTNVQALAVDQQGAIYTSSSIGLKKLDVSGRRIADWGLRPAAGRADKGLLIIDSTNTLNVFTYEHGFRRFTTSGDLIGGWPEPSHAASSGFLASDMAVDQQGNVYLVSWNDDNVKKFSPTGEVLAIWGRRGDGPGEFREPNGIAVDQWGNVYVADFGNDRVQQLSPSGSFIAAWGGPGSAPGQFRRLGGIAIDARGDVYVVDSGNYRIQRIPAAPPP